MRVVLLSNSCTTGWASWGHGELWLTPDSIVRIGKKSLTRAQLVRGGLAGGLGGGLLAGVAVAMIGAESRTAIDVMPTQWNAYLSGHPRRVEIAMSQVAQAEVKRGLMTSALNVKLRDGQRHKFLWKRDRIAVETLKRFLFDMVPATEDNKI